jgi:hypothetical protein
MYADTISGDDCGEDSPEDVDATESEDEGQDGYKKGGYHVVSIGEIYNEKYKVREININV